MEYRDFAYTNELGQVELARGSLVGIAVSWLILKSLHLGLLIVVGGVAYSAWTYFASSLHAERIAPFSPEAVAASSVPAYDYHAHPLPAHPAMMLPNPAAPHGTAHTRTHLYQRS